MEYEYDLLVFIGRFQPFHLGHKAVVDKALTKAKRVMVLIGSSERSRTIRNPWTFEERAIMILGSYQEEEGRLVCRPLKDKTYNDSAWIKQVQDIVHKEARDLVNNGFAASGHADAKIGLIGCNKDESSYYLKLFPTWGNIGVEFVVPLNATAIRNMIFEHRYHEYELLSIMPKSSVEYIFDIFYNSPIYKSIEKEYNFIKQHKELWKDAPYPPTFQTVDAVVEQSGHILLVRRRSEPGKGLWALPGGYLNQKETLLNGMIRELREETKIKVPEKVLRGSIVDSRVFDDPYRSDRGRIITKAFHIKLEDQKELPKVKGSDDADKAVWVPIAQVREEDLFEDHYHIICNMLGLSYD